jgi:hypothetical protein
VLAEQLAKKAVVVEMEFERVFAGGLERRVGPERRGFACDGYLGAAVSRRAASN